MQTDEAKDGTAAEGRPVPRPDQASERYWEEARAGRLSLGRCTSCGRMQYPPEVLCTFCQGEDFEPTTLSGRGTLWSFAVVERPFHPGFVPHLPYVVGVVELEEQADLRMLTNIVDADPAGLRVGMPVEVTFERRGDAALPQFRPAQRTGGDQPT